MEGHMMENGIVGTYAITFFSLIVSRSNTNYLSYIDFWQAHRGRNNDRSSAMTGRFEKL